MDHALFAKCALFYICATIVVVMQAVKNEPFRRSVFIV